MASTCQARSGLYPQVAFRKASTSAVVGLSAVKFTGFGVAKVKVAGAAAVGPGAAGKSCCGVAVCANATEAAGTTRQNASATAQEATARYRSNEKLNDIPSLSNECKNRLKPGP